MLKKTLGVIKRKSLLFIRWLDPVAYARKIGVNVGENCRFIGVKFGTEPYLVTIGDHVSATNTVFVTHDGGVWVFRDKCPKIDLVAPIRVGNNVFLGEGCIVLPGVTIGNNVVVGAGAIVSKDIPSNTVAVGVPAKPLKTMDEYYESIKDRAVDIKQLGPKDKRDYLINLFKA